MLLLKKALHYLLEAQKETRAQPTFKQFAQKCNKYKEVQERTSELKKLENQFDEYA